MRNANQETIADIVADIRAQNQGLPEDSYALSPLVCDLLSFADRIEAAAKREREATREESSQVGNAAKMREALSDACYAMFNFLKTQNGGYGEMAKALDKAKAALAAPPRNCDVGTDEEQSRRYEELCDRHTCGSRCSASGCPMYEHDCSPFAWGQMPYEEGGTK